MANKKNKPEASATGSTALDKEAEKAAKKIAKKLKKNDKKARRRNKDYIVSLERVYTAAAFMLEPERFPRAPKSFSKRLSQLESAVAKADKFQDPSKLFS